MQRRRFFPARPVQQVPGQRVEVAVQVRRESAAAVTADPNGGGSTAVPVQDLGLTGWVCPAPLLRSWDRWESAEIAPGQWRFGNSRLSSLWLGSFASIPNAFFDESLGLRDAPWWRGDEIFPLPSGALRCVRIDALVSMINEDGQPVFVGAYFGAQAESVVWEIEWSRAGDNPWKAQEGHIAVPYGAQVHLCTVPQAEDIADNVMLAKAFLDGQEVGRLEFVATTRSLTQEDS